MSTVWVVQFSGKLAQTEVLALLVALMCNTVTEIKW